MGHAHRRQLSGRQPIVVYCHTSARRDRRGLLMLQLPTLLIQIVIILATARGIGWLFRMIRQPQVVGEMVAGILLGPSLLGWLAPGVSAALFPSASLSLLNALSQVGLIVF